MAKTYSEAQVKEMLQTIMQAVQKGDLQNTVFGAPADSSTYDVTASQANGMVENLYQTYYNTLSNRYKSQRVHAFAAATGFGKVGGALMGQIMHFNPELGNAMLGLHGIDQAAAGFIQSADAIARAGGGVAGSLYNPAQAHSNVARAVSLGSRIFKNNFNDDGTINTDFTGGLSLNQSGFVSRSMMSSRENTLEWGRSERKATEDFKKEWIKNNQDKMTDDGKMPAAYYRDLKNAGRLGEQEINMFEQGIARTRGATDSYVNKMKDFQKGINSLLASMSKVTGSFDTAVDFLQDMTNGKAFTIGSEANEVRERARVVTANVRAMAASAHMDPREFRNLYRMVSDKTEGIGAQFNYGQGLDDWNVLFGDRKTGANLEALTAGAMAAFKKNHPDATPEEMQRREIAYKQRAKAYGAGDMSKLVPILSYLTTTGQLQKEDVKRIVESGDAEVAYRTAKRHMGNEIDTILANRGLRERFGDADSNFTQDMQNLGMSAGIQNEGIVKNQQEAISLAKRMVSSQMTQKTGEHEAANIAQMDVEAVLESLEESGVNETDIEALRKMAKEDDIADGNYLARQAVNNYGANEMALNAARIKNLRSKIQTKYGADGENALKAFDLATKGLDAEVTDDDIRLHRTNKKVAAINRENLHRRTRYLEDKKNGTAEGEKQAQTEIDNAITSILGGVKDNSTLTLDNVDFTRSMFEGFLSNKEEYKNLSPEKQKTVMADALRTYNDAMAKGLSVKDAVKMSSNTLEDIGIGGFESWATEEKRKEAAEKFIVRGMTRGIVNQIFNETDLKKKGLNDDQIKETKEKIQGRIFKQIRENFGSLKNKKEYKGKEGAALYREMATDLARTAALEVKGPVDKDGKPIIEEDTVFTSNQIDRALNAEGAEMQGDLTVFDVADTLTANKSAIWRETDGKGASEEEKRRARSEKIGNEDTVYLSDPHRVSTYGGKELSEANETLQDKSMSRTVTSLDARQAKAKAKGPWTIKKYSVDDVISSEKQKALENVRSKLMGDLIKLANEKNPELAGSVGPDGFNIQAISTYISEFVKQNAELSDKEMLKAAETDPMIGGKGPVPIGKHIAQTAKEWGLSAHEIFGALQGLGHADAAGIKDTKEQDRYAAQGAAELVVRSGNAEGAQDSSMMQKLDELVKVCKRTADAVENTDKKTK